MIQRIQTLYFSLVTILSVLLFRVSFITVKDSDGALIRFTASGVSKIVQGSVSSSPETGDAFLYKIFVVLIIVLSLSALFLFKKRQWQIRFTIALLAAAAGFIAVSVFYGAGLIMKSDASFLPGIWLIIPVLIPVLAFLALRAVRHDDELVRSYDRIR